MLLTRGVQPAFHPDTPQAVPPVPTPGVIAVERTAADGNQRLLCLVNVTAEPVTPDLSAVPGVVAGIDLLTEAEFTDAIPLPPFGAVWLELA